LVKEIHSLTTGSRAAEVQRHCNAGDSQGWGALEIQFSNDGSGGVVRFVKSPFDNVVVLFELANCLVTVDGQSLVLNSSVVGVLLAATTNILVMLGIVRCQNVFLHFSDIATGSGIVTQYVLDEMKYACSQKSSTSLID